MQETSRKALEDIIRYIPSAAIPSALGVVAVAAFTRLLPPEEYGYYTLVFTTVLFVHTFAFSWINQSVIRYFERFRGADQQTLFATLILTFGTLMILTALAWYAVMQGIELQQERLRGLLMLGPPVVLIYSGGALLLSFERAARNSLKYSLLTTLNAILKLLTALLIIYGFNGRADALLLGIVAAGAIVFLPEWIRLTRRWPPLPSKFRMSILRGCASYGFPIVGMAVVNIVLSASDRYLIEYYLGSSDVGIYSAGYKITEAGVMLFVSLLMLASFPALVEAYEQTGVPRTKALMNDLLKVYLLLLIPVLVGLIMLSGDFIKAVLGAPYVAAGRVVPWIAAGAFFMGLCQYYNKSFELKEKTPLLLILFTLAASANILLNMALIPRFGITGAALSTCLSYMLALVFSIVFGAGLLRWDFPWKSALAALVGSVFMAAVLLFLPSVSSAWPSLLIKITAGAGVYAGILWAASRALGQNLAGSFFFERCLNRKPTHRPPSSDGALPPANNDPTDKL